MHLDECISYQQINTIASSPIYKNTLNKTVSYFENWALYANEAIPHNLYLGKPNLTTTTYNKREEYFLGMHLDSWEKKKLDERPTARNRICINLSKEPRSLFFYNLSYNEMIKIGGYKNDPSSPNEGPCLQNFFSCYSNYPVTKIIIRPYEAYIAPTENIIHDGSTENNKFPDVNLAIRGYYKLPATSSGILASLRRFFPNLL